MKFECPHCGQHYEADDSYYGKRITCANCNGDISIDHPDDDIITLREEKKNNNLAIVGIIAFSVIVVIGAIVWLSGSKDREIRERINYCLLNNNDIENVGNDIKELCRIYGNDIVEKHLNEMNSKENLKYKNKVKEQLKEDLFQERINEYDSRIASLDMAIIALKTKLLKSFYGVNVDIAMEEMVAEEEKR